MTEAEWRACADPLLMPRQHRGRSTPRKRCLLACAYLLHSPGGLASEAARRVVEAVRSASFNDTSNWGGRADIRAAVARVLPDCADLTNWTTFWTLWQRFRGRSEFSADGERLAGFLHGCACQLPSAGDVNAVAMGCLSTVRGAAAQEVCSVLNAIFKEHGPRVTEVLKEKVFALIPEPEQAKVRHVPWHHARVPACVRNKVYAAAYRPRVAAASVALAALVREVLGSPFRRTPIDPTWLIWNHGAARHIAEQIATSGNFTDLPVLADALEDAGCGDAELLRHMRCEPVHVPGCWALDAVLGRA